MAEISSLWSHLWKLYLRLKEQALIYTCQMADVMWYKKELFINQQFGGLNVSFDIRGANFISFLSFCEWN